MRKNNQVANDAVGHYENLRKPGAETVDTLRFQLRNGDLLGDLASPGGLAMSLVYGQEATQPDAIGPYQPGIDSMSSIAYHLLSEDVLKAKKRPSLASPSRVHHVIDEPHRTESLEGYHRYTDIGRFTTATVARIGEAIGDARLTIYHTRSQAADATVYDDDPRDVYAYFSQEEQLHEEDDKKLLADMISTAGHSVQHDSEAAVIVSDLMSGYDVDRNRFDWEEPLAYLCERVDGRLWLMRVTAPSYRGLGYGSSEGHDAELVERIVEGYSALAEQKSTRIEQVLQYINPHYVKIDTASTHPTRHIIESLTGDTIS